MNHSTNNLPILMYHAIWSSADGSLPLTESHEHAVEAGDFRDQLDAIVSGGDFHHNTPPPHPAPRRPPTTSLTLPHRPPKQFTTSAPPPPPPKQTPHLFFSSP